MADTAEILCAIFQTWHLSLQKRDSAISVMSTMSILFDKVRMVMRAVAVWGRLPSARRVRHEYGNLFSVYSKVYSIGT